MGEHATERPLLVTSVYAAYVIMPLLVLARVWQPDVFPIGAKPATKQASNGVAHTAAGKGAVGSRRRSKSPASRGA